MDKNEKREKRYIVQMLLCVFIGSLFLLSFISYSDGDDTFFQIYTREMGFWEYISWRYETWSGRVVAEALLYAFFHMDLWIWRIVNAMMLTALPFLLTKLVEKIYKETNMLLITMVSLMIFFLLDIKVLGYAGIWMTGSINYLWPDVCGLLVLGGVAVYLQDEKLGNAFGMMLLCAMVAAMCSEQMGAVLLAFEVLCTLKIYKEKRSINYGLVAITIVTLASFLISSMAPGNALRVAESIEVYMPQFRELSMSEKGFMLAQWLLSSFAKENVAFLIAIWGGLFLWFRMEGKHLLLAGLSFGGMLVGVCAKMGINALSDMGLDTEKMLGFVEQVPKASMLNRTQWAAMCFWGCALILTFFLLWKATNRDGIVLLTYLGAIASEAVMIFSPTIYSSGTRVYFLTGIMLMFIILVFVRKFENTKYGVPYAIFLGALGLAHFLVQIW